eukprot:scaffold2858_cov659-Pavlova_lutheri.AAC.199
MGHAGEVRRWTPVQTTCRRRRSVRDERALLARAGRVLAVSDVHADRPENWKWVVERLADRQRNEDVLLLPGDLCEDEITFRNVLSRVRPLYRDVFLCFGNHDLWVHHRGSDEDAADDSLSKMDRLEAICREEGVKTKPDRIENVWIVPLHSWHHKSFDKEGPEADWEAKLWSHGWTRPAPRDYEACVWPGALGELPAGDEGVARHFDELNDESWERKRKVDQHVITFSHFVPDTRLNPEKRMLTHPSLLEVVGSDFLGRRVRRIGPDVHVFGHSHFGWDMVLEGTRYVQPALGYPRERSLRLRSLAISPSGTDQRRLRQALLPHMAPRSKYVQPADVPRPAWLPLPVYDLEDGLLEPRVALWSNYYEKIGRHPHVKELPPWTRARAQRIEKWVRQRQIRQSRNQNT